MVSILAAACTPDAPEAGPEEPTPPAAEAPVPDTAVSMTDEQVSAVPPQFVGVWDYEGGSCQPASDLRLEVGADTLTFYESQGQVEGVAMDGDWLAVTLSMAGEGETWESVQRFRLVEDDTVLEQEGRGPGGGDVIRRTRCEEQGE